MTRNEKIMLNASVTAEATAEVEASAIEASATIVEATEAIIASPMSLLDMYQAFAKKHSLSAICFEDICYVGNIQYSAFFDANVFVAVKQQGTNVLKGLKNQSYGIPVLLFSKRGNGQQSIVNNGLYGVPFSDMFKLELAPAVVYKHNSKSQNEKEKGKASETEANADKATATVKIETVEDWQAFAKLLAEAEASDKAMNDAE